MADSLRFIFASDLMLGRPLRGVTEWPDALRRDIVDAGYLAAEKVFDSVLESSSAFLLLGGNVLDASICGPRPIRFLLDQVRRLEKRSLKCFWFEGKYDHFDDWPAALPLPENLTMIPRQPSKAVVFQHQKLPDVLLCPLSRKRIVPRDVNIDDVRFTVGVGTDKTQLELIEDQVFDLICMGGKTSLSEASSGGIPVISSGTHQPRMPGPAQGGFALQVQLRPGKVSWERIPTAHVVFLEQQVDCTAVPSEEGLREMLGERALEWVAELDGRIAIARFVVQVPAAEYSKGHWEQLEKTTLQWLRREFCHANNQVWTYQIQFRASGDPPLGWYEEDTILGDYLRALREFERQKNREIDISSFIPVDRLPMRELFDLEVKGESRERLLQKARELGIVMLRG